MHSELDYLAHNLISGLNDGAATLTLKIGPFKDFYHHDKYPKLLQIKMLRSF